MELLKKIILGVCSAVITVLIPFAYATPDFGPVSMDAFYNSLPDVSSEDKLGAVIKIESINTSVIGAKA